MSVDHIINTLVEQETFENGDIVAKYLIKVEKSIQKKECNHIPIQTWNKLIERFPFFYDNYGDNTNVTDYSLKVIRHLYLKEEINFDYINDAICYAWFAFSLHPDVNLFFTLENTVNKLKECSLFHFRSFKYYTGLFSTCALNDDKIQRYVEGLLEEEAKILVTDFSILNSDFIAFIETVIEYYTEGRISIELSQMNLKKDTQIGFNSPEIVKALITCVDTKFDNTRLRCIVLGNCFNTFTLLFTTFSKTRKCILEKLAISKIVSGLNEIVSFSSISSGKYERYNFNNEFNVTSILILLRMYLLSNETSSKQRLQNCLVLLTNFSLLQKCLLANNGTVQHKTIDLLCRLFTLLPPLHEKHIHQYLSTLFPSLHFFTITLKSEMLLPSLIDFLTLLSGDKKQPLYRAFSQSSFYAYLVYFIKDPSIHPFLKDQIVFVQGIKSLIPTDDSTVNSVLEEVLKTQHTIQEKVGMFSDFLHETDLSVLNRDSHNAILCFQDLIKELDILDVYRSSAVIHLIQEIVEILSVCSDQEGLRIKVQVITLALFSDYEPDKCMVQSLISYLNSLIYQDCPDISSLELPQRSYSIVYDNLITLGIQFSFSDSTVPVRSFMKHFSGAVPQNELNNDLFTQLINFPEFAFLEDVYFRFTKAGKYDMDCFRYYYKDRLIQFDSCLYEVVYKAMVQDASNSTDPTPVSVTAPFDNPVVLKVVVLRDHEIGDTPIQVKSVNKTVDITPTEQIHELSSISSFSFLNNIIQFESHKTLMAEKGLTQTCGVLLEFVHFLVSINTYLHQFSNIIFSEQSSLEGIAAHPVNDTLFINSSLSFTLHQLLQNSCVVMGRLVPDWLEYIVHFIPQLFTLADRIDFMNTYAFDSSTAYTALFSRCEWHGMGMHYLAPPLIRIDVNRDNPISEAIYISSSISNDVEIQIKFADEEGIGNGPTQEFITLFSEQLRRRELHLWNEMDQEPYPFQSVVRMLNYPIRGPGEGVVTEEVQEEMDGTFLRCYKCACLNSYCCPHHDCILSIDRSTNMMYCRECDYVLSINDLTCEYCHLPSSAFQIYWFIFPRTDLQRVVTWFKEHPEKDVCFFGTFLCSLCNKTSFSDIYETEKDALNQSCQNSNLHSHENRNIFHCILRSAFTRSIIHRIQKSIGYSKPCKHIALQYSFDYSHVQYNHSQYGLMPAPLFSETPLFEDTKSTFFSFGMLLGFSLRAGVTMDLHLNPLFLRYIQEGVPDICSIDEALLLLSLFSPDQYFLFSKLFDQAKALQQGKEADIQSFMLDCSLPANPAINLLPEFTHSPEEDLSEEHFPLWLSRYVHYLIGEGIKPVIHLIQAGIEYIFPPKYLKLFSLSEFSLLAFGEKMSWTREFVSTGILYTQGYNTDQPYIQDFIDVVLSFTPEEQEKLLLFVTGQRKLDLQSRLRDEWVFSVVEKVNCTEHSLPTASTCIKQLHLPRYPSKEILREKLLQAVTEGYMKLLLK